MPYCSIDEAFPDTASNSGVVARKEERRRARKCGGPALKFLKGLDKDEMEEIDPDRPGERPMPPPESMKGSEGFVSQMKNKNEESGVDVIGRESSNKSNTAKLLGNIHEQKQMQSQGTNHSYFGKSPSDIDGFADFSSSLNDNPGYQVMPADFLGSFGAVGVDKASGKTMLPTPSVNDAWKPLTPSGARTSFFESLPYPGGETSSGNSFSREEKESLLKKLDTLFAKLEDLESQHNEYAHTEITLFVLSGLFLLYGIESLKKFGRR